MADFKKPKSDKGGGGSSSGLVVTIDFLILLVIIGTIASNVFHIGISNILFSVRQYFSPMIEGNLWWLQILSIIASALFLWGTVYIINQTNYFTIKREQYLEVLGKDYLSKDRSLRIWKQILRRLESEDPNNWRLAVLECDHVLNEILKMSGYLGSMDEKLPKLDVEQLANIEDVRRAHAVRDKISRDPAFPITKEEAIEVAKIYEQSFRDLNLLRD